ncbi:MAG: translation initiation factor IF-3 [Saprospiraceae bacterium]|nr:translation initiation factor IF-3 [Saprospiraceae bacterium]
MAKRQKKTRQKDTYHYRTNDSIRVPQIRLVGDNLKTLSETIGQSVEAGIYQTDVAKEWALEMGLDLVEISPSADPPVCKIIDYKKFVYDKKKRDKEIKSRTIKTVIKELRFGPNTDDHDFDFKLKHAKKFLEDGAKVRAYVQFRGRSIVFKERGELLLLRFLKELEEHGAAEELPRLEGRRMSVIVSPKKKK